MSNNGEAGRVLLVDDNPSKSTLAALAGILGGVGMFPLFDSSVPKAAPRQAHERHQGGKERERRLKRQGGNK